MKPCYCSSLVGQLLFQLNRSGLRMWAMWWQAFQADLSFKPLTTNTVSSVDFPWYDRVLENCLNVSSGHCEGPYKVFLGVEIWGGDFRRWYIFFGDCCNLWCRIYFEKGIMREWCTTQSSTVVDPLCLGRQNPMTGPAWVLIFTLSLSTGN